MSMWAPAGLKVGYRGTGATGALKWTNVVSPLWFQYEPQMGNRVGQIFEARKAYKCKKIGMKGVNLFWSHVVSAAYVHEKTNT